MSDSKVTWLTPALEAWEAKFGAGSFYCVKNAKILNPLRKAGHSPEKIGEHLRRYLQVADLRYLSLARFVETFAMYAPQQLMEPSAAGLVVFNKLLTRVVLVSRSSALPWAP